MPETEKVEHNPLILLLRSSDKYRFNVKHPNLYTFNSPLRSSHKCIEDCLNPEPCIRPSILL
jgi:hypothetical protein